MCQLTSFTNPRMHLFHIPQCNIQNRNVHISVLNVALWDMEQVHSGICEIGLFHCLYIEKVVFHQCHSVIIISQVITGFHVLKRKCHFEKKISLLSFFLSFFLYCWHISNDNQITQIYSRVCFDPCPCFHDHKRQPANKLTNHWRKVFLTKL